MNIIMSKTDSSLLVCNSPSFLCGKINCLPRDIQSCLCQLTVNYREGRGFVSATAALLCEFVCQL